MNSNLPEPGDKRADESSSTRDVLATCSWCGAVVAYYEPGVVNLDVALAEHLEECENGLAARADIAARETPQHGPEGWPIDLLPVELVTLDLGATPADDVVVVDQAAVPAGAYDEWPAAYARPVLSLAENQEHYELLRELTSACFHQGAAYGRGDDVGEDSPTFQRRMAASTALSRWMSARTDWLGENQGRDR